MTYPEHEKLRKISDKSQVVGEFLEWLEDTKGWRLARWGRYINWMEPVHYDVQDILAEFFGIDRDRLDAEKDAMLEELRKANQ